MVALSLLAAVALVGWSLLILRPPGSYRADPPAPTLLTAAVEERALQEALILQGTLQSAITVPVECSPMPTGQPGARVFTRPPSVGAPLEEGDVLAGINGRPVLVLQGSVREFRSMLPGSRGTDIDQLRAALERLGYLHDGGATFDAAAQEATRGLYRKAGFEAVEPTLEQLTEVRSAEVAARAAASERAAAQQALETAKSGASRIDILSAKLAVVEAEQSLAASTKAERAKAELALQLARARLTEVQKSPDTQKEARALASAREAEKSAEDALSQLRSRVGLSIPFCEVIFVPELPLEISAFNATGAGDASEGTGGSAASAASWAELGSSRTVVALEAPADQADQLTPGQSAVIEAADGPIEATVSRITRRADGEPVEVVVDPPAGERMASLARGARLRVRLPLGAAQTEPSLVVPVTALRLNPRGVPEVRKHTGDDAELVEVEQGLTAQGFVAVKPRVPGALKAGDHVVISS